MTLHPSLNLNLYDETPNVMDRGAQHIITQVSGDMTIRHVLLGFLLLLAWLFNDSESARDLGTFLAMAVLLLKALAHQLLT